MIENMEMFYWKSKNKINFKVSRSDCTANLLKLSFEPTKPDAKFSLIFNGDNLFSRELLAHLWYKVNFLALIICLIVF